MPQTFVTSAFNPTGSHVAYVVQSLDVQVLKVQSASQDKSASNGVIVHPIDKKEYPGVKCLKWISEDILACVFNGSNKLLILDTSSNEVVSVLKTEQLILSISVSTIQRGRVFVLDSNTTVIQYQLEPSFSSWRLEKATKLEEEISSTTDMIDFDERYLFLFSNSAYVFDKQEGKICDFKNLYISTVNSAVKYEDQNGVPWVIVSANNDRFINTVGVTSDGLINNSKQILITENPILELCHNSISDPDMEVITALTENGALEIFNNPFGTENASSQNKSKRRRRNQAVKSKRSDAKIVLDRVNASVDNKSEAIFIENVSIGPRYLTICYPEDSSYLSFTKKEWWTRSDKNSECQYSVLKDVKIVKERSLGNLEKDNQHYNSDRSSAKAYKENYAIDLEIGEAAENEAFGTLVEKLQSTDIKGLNGDKNRSKRKLNVGSLSVVLSQALKSNDHGLLETVLNNCRDEEVIKSTICRLDTSYILTLLNRLSERLSRGKASKNKQQYQLLDAWVKYILIYHGSYLISLPNLNADLGILTTTLRRRARNMDRLMELKEQGLSENYSGKATADKEEEAAVEYVEALDDAGLESDEDDDKDENTDDSDAADAAQVEDDSEDDAGSEITDNDAGLSDVE
ncbi:hypothetical protein HII13_002400 [Brettanomyces bruxellensis]|nr:hypothetical protein HII13_002400 [Brettanomyces bruxellensis]